MDIADGYRAGQGLVDRILELKAEGVTPDRLAQGERFEEFTAGFERVLKGEESIPYLLGLGIALARHPEKRTVDAYFGAVKKHLSTLQAQAEERLAQANADIERADRELAHLRSANLVQPYTQRDLDDLLR